MTMVSFRVDDAVAGEIGRWADELGVDRSELVREALRRYLNLLASEHEAASWDTQTVDDGASPLAAIADWGPAEDWSDWADASR